MHDTPNDGAPELTVVEMLPAGMPLADASVAELDCSISRIEAAAVAEAGSSRSWIEPLPPPTVLPAKSMHVRLPPAPVGSAARNRMSAAVPRLLSVLPVPVKWSWAVSVDVTSSAGFSVPEWGCS